MAAYTDYDLIYENPTRSSSVANNPARGSLYQGSYPKLDKDLGQHFDVVVFTAVEKQPKPAALKSVPKSVVIKKFPLDDDPYQPVTRDQAAALMQAAKELGYLVKSGKRVLITCAMGMNRSGLLTALTLMATTGCNGRNAVQTVQSRRRAMDDGTRALFNPIFARFVQTLPPIA